MLSLVKAKQKDYPFIARVYRSVSPLYEPIMPGFSEECAVEIENLNEPLTRHQAAIISLDNEAIGFSSLLPLSEEITYMVAFYFLMEYQRCGYGSGALQQILKNLKRKNIRQILLLAHKQAYWAINFYQKNGFRIVTDKESIIRTYANKAMDNLYVSDTYLMSRFIK
jgi:ribosomal protein S18 acetylase RimI-like enzyme